MHLSAPKYQMLWGADVMLTNRAHRIRRKKGIVLNDTSILGFIRDPFIANLKSSAKMPITTT
jgi:hypothetical protein